MMRWSFIKILRICPKNSLIIKETIHGGTNYAPNKNRDYVHDVVYPHGPTDPSAGVPWNILTVGVGPGFHVYEPIDIEQEKLITEKTKVDFYGTHGRLNDIDYKEKVKGHYGFPFNLLTSSSCAAFSCSTLSNSSL